MKNIFLSVALGVIFIGCSVLKPTVDNTRFYVLSAETAQPLSGAGTGREIAVGLGPVFLPAYLDNPFIAVRKSDVEIDYAKSHRWGEQLERGIQRALRDNLRTLLGPPDITIMQQTRRSNARYVITLDFSQFELTPQGHAVVRVSWRISNPSADSFERTGNFGSEVQFISNDVDYAAGVAALSAALTELSQELATVINGN